MNILVTGANGFIGKYICNRLNEDGHKIYKLVNSIKETSKNTFGINLTDTIAIKELAVKLNEIGKIDIIIHLATKMINSSQDNANQFEVFMDNVLMYRNIVELSKLLAIRKIINFSTIGVYPNEDGLFGEESKVYMAGNAECYYGLSKFCGENILAHELEPIGIDVINLRVAQVYGEGMRSDRVYSMMKSELMTSNKITVFGNGERMSNFIEIKILFEFLTFFIENKVTGVFNIGDESISYKALALKIIKTYGNENSFIVSKEAGLKSKFLLDVTKSKKMLDGRKL